jgi:peptide/nickel transport system permease protein
MLRFLATRTGIFVGSLFGASLLIFFLMNALGGDAATVMLGQDASPEALAALRSELGLDQPLAFRYLHWVSGLLTFNFGRSYVARYDIGTEMLRRLELTVPLAVAALFVSTLIGLPLGLVAAVKRGSLVGKLLHGFSQIGITIPTFWSGIILSLIFAVYLGWLPPGGFIRPSQNFVGMLRSLILPTTALVLVESAILARYARAAILDVLSEDYMRTARSLGLGRWRAVFRHGLRNASIPLVTVIGLQFGHLIGGAVVIESVFYLPGIGRLVVDAVAGRDSLVVQSTVMVLTAFVLTLNFLTDVAYGLIDPRIRQGGEPA